jgi:type II secretory ATPase GspE/PulE/Tfp pilus assembly ATPase PilB-like protein
MNGIRRVAGPCSECGVLAQKLSRGLCRKHYGAWVRAERAKQPCSMDNCNKPVKALNLCERHYTRNLNSRRLEKEIAWENMMKKREEMMLVMKERNRVVAILNYYKYRDDASIDQILQEVIGKK